MAFEKVTRCIGLDVETTGLPKQDKYGNADFSGVHVCRIGVVRGDLTLESDGRPRFERHGMMCFDVLVKLPAGAFLSSEAARVNGLTDDRLAAEGADFYAAIAELVEFCGEPISGGESPEFAAVVGQNLVGFDRPALLDQFSRAQKTDPVLGENLLLLVGDAGAFDTKLIWNAYNLGLRRNRWEGLEGLYGRVRGVRTEGKSNLDHLATIFLGADRVRQGEHNPVEDARLAVEIFAAMQARGIVEAVLG